MFNQCMIIISKTPSSFLAKWRSFYRLALARQETLQQRGVAQQALLLNWEGPMGDDGTAQGAYGWIFDGI